jgi:dedicator of cytokinesis protein 3
MPWKPLQVIIYGFAVHPLSSSTKTDEQRTRLSGLPEQPDDDEEQNPYVVALEVGDEIYAFEEYTPNGNGGNGVWYRG